MQAFQLTFPASLRLFSVSWQRSRTRMKPATLLWMSMRRAGRAVTFPAPMQGSEEYHIGDNDI